jgi:hypothetical protein
MQLRTARTSQPDHPSKEPIPYSSAALRQDLQRVRNVWLKCQASRNRNAIYRYLNAVYGLVAWWAAEGQEIDRARRALCLMRLDPLSCRDPFGAVILCTADPTKADKRTRSSGAASCGTQQCTSWIPSRWVNSSEGRAASMRVPLVSLGASGDVRQLGRGGIWREDDGLDSHPEARPRRHRSRIEYPAGRLHSSALTITLLTLWTLMQSVF